MWPFLSVLIGLALVIGSLYLIRRDIELGNIKLTKGLDGVSDRNLERIIKYLDDLETSIDEMNQAFYDLVADIEGETALNQKELSLLSDRLEVLEGKIGIMKQSKEALTDVIPVEQIRSELSSYERRDRSVTRPTVQPVQTTESNQPVSLNHLSPDGIREVKMKIVSLKKKGYTMNQIAKELGVGVGELQLFIKLNTK